LPIEFRQLRPFAPAFVKRAYAPRGLERRQTRADLAAQHSPGRGDEFQEKKVKGERKKGQCGQQVSEFRLQSGFPFANSPTEVGTLTPLSELHSISASRIRSAVRPSQNSGMRALESGKGLSNARVAAATILFVSVPAIVFVPISTVIGRSVFSRSVMHGIPAP